MKLHLKLFILFTFCIGTIHVFSQNIDLKINNDIPFTYDSKIPLGIEFSRGNGDVKKTRGFLKGDLKWSQFKVTVEGGKVKRGVLHVCTRDELIVRCHVIVTVIHKKTGVKNTFTLTPKYNQRIQANFQPKKPNKPSQYKYSFFNHLFKIARDGKEGKKGKQGYHLEVKLREMNLCTRQLLNVEVKYLKKTKYYTLDPSLCTITVSANGGDGGDGGDGENAISKYSEQNEYNTENKDGGNGGEGGIPGNGGSINVVVYGNAKNYMKSVHFMNTSGLPGEGGIGGDALGYGTTGSEGKTHFMAYIIPENGPAVTISYQ